MDKTEIMRKFLAGGYQLGSDALAYFEENPEKVSKFLDLATGRLGKQIVTRKAVDSILSKVSPDIGVKIVRDFSRKPGDVSVGGLSEVLSKRYDKISEMLSKKKELANLMSINRASKSKKFSIIAMIRDIDRDSRTLVVEDPTGTAYVYVPESLDGSRYLVEDEVVGLVCDNEGSSENRAVKIVSPDIPLSTEFASSDQDVTCLFVSDVHMDDPSFQSHALEKLGNYLKKVKGESIAFVLGDVSKKREDLERFKETFPKNFSVIFLKGEFGSGDGENWLPDPVVVEVGGVKMFLSHGNKMSGYMKLFGTSADDMLLQLIKKRHMSPTVGESGGMDDSKLILDDVPDVFVIGHYHKPNIMNYKGATLITLGSFVTQPVFWAINLKTRENIKIDLT